MEFMERKEQMLTVEPTAEMLAEWKIIFEKHHLSMKPNRKSGTEIDSYFRGKYTYQPYNNAEFAEIVSRNITENEVFVKSCRKAHSQIFKAIKPAVRLSVLIYAPVSFMLKVKTRRN